MPPSLLPITEPQQALRIEDIHADEPKSRACSILCKAVTGIAATSGSFAMIALTSQGRAISPNQDYNAKGQYAGAAFVLACGVTFLAASVTDILNSRK